MLGLRARNALVVAEIALSMILLIGTALLMRSLARFSHVNPGFDPSNLLTLRISLPLVRYDTNQKQAAFFDELIRRVQSVAGVRNVAAGIRPRPCASDKPLQCTRALAYRGQPMYTCTR